ncbi:MAG: NADH-quinone oxidoreductase subunit J [Deltaproteobacteria bacterium]|nr:NADH-quinone oxidoreductase subunit J [Deltaproteobacteria bacterium]
MERFFFLVFAVSAVFSAIAVVGFRNPVHSAIALMVCFFQVAALFVLLRAPFLAAVQVFIYVGAVMVLFLFVVFLLDIRKAVMDIIPRGRRSVVAGLLAVFSSEIILLVFFGGLGAVEMREPLIEETKVEGLAKTLFTDYLFPFEVVSVVLLVAMVGAIVMTRGVKR